MVQKVTEAAISSRFPNGGQSSSFTYAINWNLHDDQWFYNGGFWKSHTLHVYNYSNSYVKFFKKFLFTGVILRPGYIYGKSESIIFAPFEKVHPTDRYICYRRWFLKLEMTLSCFLQVLQYAEPLRRIPLIGPVFTPPVSVFKVAKVIVRGVTDPTFSPGVVDLYTIIRLGKELWPVCFCSWKFHGGKHRSLPLHSLDNSAKHCHSYYSQAHLLLFQHAELSCRQNKYKKKLILS